MKIARDVKQVHLRAGTIVVVLGSACGGPEPLTVIGSYSGQIGAAAVEIPAQDPATAEVNQGDGSFTATILASGITYSLHGTSNSGSSNEFEASLGGSQTFGPGLCPINVRGPVLFSQATDGRLRLTGALRGTDCRGNFVFTLALVRDAPPSFAVGTSITDP